MAATMKKEDVKLTFVDISRINWNEVKTVAGKAAPQLAKNVADELSKKVKHRELKKPYAKVGLIGRDLYLRFKDGSNHLEDVLLVKSWTDPSGAATQVDPTYQRKVDEFIQSRKDLLEAITQGEKIIKQQYQQIEALRDQAQSLAKATEQAAQKGEVDDKAIAASARLVTAAQKLLQLSQDRFDRHIHPPMDEHRTISTVPGINSADIMEWGKNWFIQKVNPGYQKAKDYLRLSETAVQQCVDAKLAVDRWITSGHTQVENYARVAEKVKDVCEKEMESAKAVWGMSPINNVASGLTSDFKSIEGFIAANQWEFAQRTIDNASGKTSKAAQNYKLMVKHLEKLASATKPIDSLPREIQKHESVKPHCTRVKQLQQEAKAYERECQGYLKDALKVFEKIKKLQRA